LLYHPQVAYSRSTRVRYYKTLDKIIVFCHRPCV
jgi:hypothetical protein